jgi:hypothetical protein
MIILGSIDYLSTKMLLNFTNVIDTLFECDSCNKIFGKKKKRMIQHRLAHFDSRNYRCNACNTMFKSIKYLNKHNRNVHGNGQIKNTICDRYDKLYSRSRLNKHYLIVHQITDEKMQILQSIIQK